MSQGGAEGRIAGTDCNTFLDIPVYQPSPDGGICINRDFEMVTKLHLAAKAKDPNNPTGPFLDEVQLGPGEETSFLLEVDREENGMGHFLINELLMLTNPAGAGSLKIDITSAQQNRNYTNASVFNWTVFGNAHLNTCLPCPIFLFPNQTIVFKVRNFESVDVKIRIVARGKRFMPYHDMALASVMEQCWLKQRTIPMWLGLDDLQVLVPANGTARGQITVPGGGFFELKYVRGKVQPVGGPTAEDLLVNVSDGRIGRRLMNEPIPLSLYMTEDKRGVTGMPGDLYRSASASHCPGPPMIFRGNTRIIHDFQNLVGALAAVEITLVGCFHYMSNCPPASVLEEARALYPMNYDPYALPDDMPQDNESEVSGLGQYGGEWEVL